MVSFANKVTWSGNFNTNIKKLMVGTPEFDFQHSLKQYQFHAQIILSEIGKYNKSNKCFLNIVSKQIFL
jgi:hypothetical protein